MAKPDPAYLQNVFDAVKQRDARLAVALSEECNKHIADPHPEFPIVGPSVDTIRLVFTDSPKLLWRFPSDLMEHARTAAAMNFLTGRARFRDWLPGERLTNRGFDLEYAVRAIVCYVQCKWSIESWKQTGIGGTVEIVNSNDPPCAPCRALGGRRWKLGEQPELPYEHCVNPPGCHCAYEIYVEDKL